jgi:multicomponent Na+:H+ antiporter subunit E
MKGLGWNVGLMAVWLGLTGELTFWNASIGFGMGFAILVITGRLTGTEDYTSRVWHAVVLAAFFLRDLVITNLQVALDVVTPRSRLQPAIIALPLDVKNDLEITLLANLITLTPGTTALDVDERREYLFVHLMYMEPGGLEAAQAEIKSGLERRVLEVTR